MTVTSSRCPTCPAGPHGRSRTITLSRESAVIVAVVLALAGCGGSEPQFTRESVEETMTEAIRGELGRQAPGATMDQLECVKDGDEYHWRCITTALDDGQRYRLSVAITCDGETARCISEPVALAPLP